MMSTVLGEIYSFFGDIFCFGSDICLELGGAYIFPVLIHISFYYMMHFGEYLHATYDFNPIHVGIYPFYISLIHVDFSGQFIH